MSSTRFVTTQWSLVLAAADRGAAAAESALAELCSLYWYPVFAVVRRQGHPAADAQDLTQGFFTRLIEKNDLQMADRGRGRFRSFLLASCQHYLSNERDRATALKRGGGRPLLSIDLASAEARYEALFADLETPERLYERQWTRSLLARALDDLRGECAAAGKERLFDRLSGFLTDDDRGRYAEAARDLEIDFRVEDDDLGGPGSSDTFLITWTGYSAGGVLGGGNIQIVNR